MPTRAVLFAAGVVLMAVAGCGGAPPAASTGVDAKPAKAAAKPWFGPKSGLNNAVNNFSGGPQFVNGPPQYELIDHFPEARPEALLSRYEVTTTDPAGEGGAQEVVVRCLRGVYAGMKAADFAKVTEAASARGWTQQTAGEEIAFLDEKQRRALILTQAAKGDPALPRDVSRAAIVELCQWASPKMELAPIKAQLVYDWRMTPVKELSELLDRAPREVHLGRVARDFVGGASFAIGAADEATVMKWITDHGFVEAAEQAGPGKRFTLGAKALMVEVTLTGGEAGRLTVLTTT